MTGRPAPGSGRKGLLATALADGMLAGPWAADRMLARVRRVAGNRHPWLRELVAETLAGYPHPPADRPGELAAFVVQTAALRRAEFTAGRRETPLPKPAHRLTAPTRMLGRPFVTPRLDNAADLADYLDLTVAELVRFADTDLRTRRAPQRLRLYRYRWVESAHRSPRLLEIPRPRLAELQRRLLRGVLAGIGVHRAAHGFVAGRSALTGAMAHVGAGIVICLDLESFFAAVTAGRVWGVLRAAGYPEPVAHLLTGLLTTAVPAGVLGAMAAGGDDSARFRLRRRLAAASGPVAANRRGHPDFRAHLLGRISWAASLNPGRGARLRAAFDRIAWPDA